MAAKVASIVAWLRVTAGTPRRSCSSGRASTAPKKYQVKGTAGQLSLGEHHDLRAKSASTVVL